jgi:hypothetical protein
VTVEHHQDDVHDFAWTASPHFHVDASRWSFDSFCDRAPDGMGDRIRGLLARTARHLGRSEDEIRPAREVEVRLLLQPDHDGLRDRYRAAVGAALACYQIWFGAYPYDVLTVVDPPAGGRAAGGMEYPTLITVGADRNAPEYATGLEGVTIHEFGHQYFYGLLGSNEFEEPWLDEGFTSYTDSRVFEVAYGPNVATTRYPPFHTPRHRPFEAPSVFGRMKALLRLDDWIGRIPHPWSRPEELLPVPRENGFWEYLRDLPFLHLDRRVPVVQPDGDRDSLHERASEDAMVMPGWHFASREDYRVNSYEKPAVFLYCLRGLMGEEAFDRALRAYAARHRFGHPTTRDFLAVLDEHAPDGQQALVAGFAEAMTSSAERLDVAVLEASQRDLGEGRFEWTVRVQRRGDIPVPVEVRAEDESGAVERLDLWESRGRETTRTIRVVRDRRLRSVRLGPDWLRYVDKSVANDARRADGSRDGRPAAVLAARWSLYVEEIVRTYVGLAR